MPERPSYAIFGRGRWAGRMQSILETEQRRVTCIANARRDLPESEEGYTVRLSSALRASGAQIAWLCVPPGPHVVSMMKAAIDAGVHAVAEKPWLISKSETEAVARLAERSGIALGVHFEYCLLDEIEAWRERFQGGRGLRFGGRFAVSSQDRIGIPASVNLGCHLLAMKQYALPEADIGQITCAYESDNQRKAWIETDSVEFTDNRQPIIQRFIQRFEAAIEGGEFPFGIEFARRVAEDQSCCF